MIPKTSTVCLLLTSLSVPCASSLFPYSRSFFSVPYEKGSQFLVYLEKTFDEQTSSMFLSSIRSSCMRPLDCTRPFTGNVLRFTFLNRTPRKAGTSVQQMHTKVDQRQHGYFFFSLCFPFLTGQKEEPSLRRCFKNTSRSFIQIQYMPLSIHTFVDLFYSISIANTIFFYLTALFFLFIFIFILIVGMNIMMLVHVVFFSLLHVYCNNRLTGKSGCILLLIHLSV